MFDVFDVSHVLIRSITELCAADHHNDPAVINQWIANKDPATIRDWIKTGSEIWLAERQGQPAAIGALDAAGNITLLYIDPDHTGCGVGSAVLQRLERELVSAGHSEGQLEATQTALGFYKRHGWQTTGGCSQRDELSCLHMRKSLHLPD